MDGGQRRGGDTRRPERSDAELLFCSGGVGHCGAGQQHVEGHFHLGLDEVTEGVKG